MTAGRALTPHSLDEGGEAMSARFVREAWL
jgi:hypothetical protein